MVQNLSSYNNDWYNPGSKLKILTWYFINRLILNTYLPFPNSIKINVLRLFGAKVGHGITIKPKVNIKYPWFLEIGNYCWIGEKVWIDNLAKVKIGNNVCISQGAMLLTGNHNYKKENFELILGEIVIGDSSWIGAQSIVCPGVEIQEACVLSVHSVATKNLKKNSVYQGNPATFKALRLTIPENESV